MPIDSFFYCEKRYWSLRIIRVILAGAASLLLVAGVFLSALWLQAVLGTQVVAVPEDRLTEQLVGVLSGLGAGWCLCASLILFAFSSAIQWMIHMEENTRATARLLDRLCRRHTGDGFEEVGFGSG